MPWTNVHLQWLVETEEEIVTDCGKKAKVFQFNHNVHDDDIMRKWAKHFRNHYCADNQIDLLKAPGQSRADYLLGMKFPSQKVAPGPSIRSGDFAEILVADYLAYLHDYWVPRTRYDRKGVPNESTKGSDVLAFKQDQNNASNDELLVYEVKAKLSSGSKPMLQEAITHSAKDEFRIAESLNGIKQRMVDRQDYESAHKVSRFQNSVDSPYKLRFGAASVCSDSSHDPNVLSQASTTEHPYADSLELIAIHGQELMSLAHTLYERAAHEV